MAQDARFEKSLSCPANEELLAFIRRALDPATAGRVGAHLEDCEFCALLSELLKSHPEGDPLPPNPPAMPDGLRLLFRQRQ